MKKILLFAALILSSQIQAAPVLTSKVWQLDDCGGGRGNTSGCETADPYLAFTDVISGPDTGLNDTLGSGAIVTVWGYGLGPTQDDNIVQFCDSANVCRNAAHVYYWKNADGNLPGGPADLYESHGMQEIAFSIPDSALGAGTIKLTVRGQESNTLPFTVRPGNIYWVAPGGDNSGDCSFLQPCEFIDGGAQPPGYAGALGNGRLQAGDTVYSRGAIEPGMTLSGRVIGMYLRGVTGTLSNQIAIVAYPNTRPIISSANQATTQYLSEGIVFYNFYLEVGHKNDSDPVDPGNPTNSNGHVAINDFGRVVGNFLTDIDGKCSTGWSGSIGNGQGQGDKGKVFGNHIKEVGCDNTSKFQHTTYFSLRSTSATIEAYEIGYNYLEDNNAIFGIHVYDQSTNGECGNITGTIKVHNNVVKNQRGPGVNIGTFDTTEPFEACWTADLEVYNNILINVGLGVPADGFSNSNAISIRGSIINDSVTVKNNTVYGYGEEVSFLSSIGNAVVVDLFLADPTVIFESNAFIQTSTDARQFWLSTTETITSDKNSFWNTVTGDANSPPAWTNNIITDPQISQINSTLTLSETSPLLSAGTTAASTRDIYGNPRGTTIGATEE